MLPLFSMVTPVAFVSTLTAVPPSAPSMARLILPVLVTVSKSVPVRLQAAVTCEETVPGQSARAVAGGMVTMLTAMALRIARRRRFNRCFLVFLLFSLAPLHNPHNYKGIEVSEKIFPKAKQIAVFDTAFHQSIPEVAFRYAIPNELYEDHQIRVYGFHGTSHKYVSEKAIAHLRKDSSKIITVHLGNGCSITAVKDGKSVEHSLGFGPMNGLMMGTRSGDIDQSVIFHMIEELGYSPEEVKTILQQKSGMQALTGYSDLREIEDAAENGDATCQLALEMNAYRVKKYIGAYVSSMNGLDALVFTAGIGENSPYMRRLICKDMSFFGIDLNEEKNLPRRKDMREIQQDEARVKVMVIPTNEEMEIAKQSFALLMEA